MTNLYITTAETDFVTVLRNFQWLFMTSDEVFTALLGNQDPPASSPTHSLSRANWTGYCAPNPPQMFTPLLPARISTFKILASSMFYPQSHLHHETSFESLNQRFLSSSKHPLSFVFLFVATSNPSSSLLLAERGLDLGGHSSFWFRVKWLEVTHRGFHPISSDWCGRGHVIQF